MNDYPQYAAPQSTSTSTSRDMKSVPLYQHDQIPYSSFQQQQQQHQPKRPSEDLSSNPINGDLQDVIFYYQSQPDMLRLILQSKVEEDRRRAEEAKLRAKELDLLMLQQQQQQQPSQQTTFTHITQTPTPVSFDEPSSFTRRPTPDTLISDHRSPTTSLSMGGASTQSDHSEMFSPITTSAVPAGPGNVAMFPMDSYPPVSKPSISSSPIMPNNNTTTMMDDNVFHLQSNDMFSSPYPSQPLQQNASSSSPPIQRYEPYYPHRPRRRREMQAVTKIVETREYPYADGYFWKNNGNTIQKKTGNKSVYYKCSNSAKGCPVNKTVTWKGNGEYLIKYRGEHLPDCGHVQRVLDM
ncbi:hypothetical protein O0I10_011230 [Lichtheimia ornata]|uniref:WRKY domain-containing protein n=1 Tax=Lichtheimia ornata TaxID=688661 RepID=A0AAD7XQL8_9FUNG|nr:uncharacterized protein O0I10_011230 [Lichtheimia ornata]KAJ8653089.1 hypothetical protein O0I10_011230 [Lichtheimia ornata]